MHLGIFHDEIKRRLFDGSFAFFKPLVNKFFICFTVYFSKVQHFGTLIKRFAIIAKHGKQQMFLASGKNKVRKNIPDKEERIAFF